jgi:DNA-binding NarL/FixJ family response regulator
VVCGEVDNGQDAVGEVMKLLPDAILLDASIPLLHGVTVAQIVKPDHPAVAVVMMSEQDTSVLARLADVAGTPHYIPKSRIGTDLTLSTTSLSQLSPLWLLLCSWSHNARR